MRTALPYPARRLATVPAVADVTLRDGSVLEVRALERGDEDLLREIFDGLGERSRYLRFLGPAPAVDEADLAYLTDVDHHRHEAVVAVDPRSGRAGGGARRVASPPGPQRPPGAARGRRRWP